MRKRSTKTYIYNITKLGVTPYKRPFLKNKGILKNNKTSLVYKGKTIDNEKQVAEKLNHTYNDMVEHTTGNKTTSVLHDTNIELSSAIDLTTITKCTLVL